MKKDTFTFNEFVEYGKTQAESFGDDGMPWHFKFRGYPVTHEDNEKYLISTPEFDLEFTPDRILVADEHGNVFFANPHQTSS